MAMVYEFIDWLKEQTDDVALRNWLDDKFIDFKKVRWTTNYTLKCPNCGTRIPA